VVAVELVNQNTPKAPKNLLIKDIGNNKISISWDADYNMKDYYIYRKNSADEFYDLSTPIAVYKVFDPADYEPDYENWPGNLPKERLNRFEIILDGDPIDALKPESKTCYFDVRE